MKKIENHLVYLLEEAKIQNELLRKILHVLAPEPSAKVVEFYTIIEGQNRRIENMFLKPADNLPMSLKIVDALGQPAKVDGLPKWALSVAELGELKVAEDGMSALFVPGGTAGLTKVQVMCDADLGEGVRELLGELDVEVLSSEAVSVTIEAGEPQPK